MITVKNLKMLQSLPSTPKKGERAVCTDEGKVYIFQEGEWQRVQNNGKFDINLYELNATAIAQLPAHEGEQLEKDKQIFDEYVNKTLGHYFILLCKDFTETSCYITLFKTEPTSFISTGKEVIECLLQTGSIQAISNEDDHIEIWIKLDDGEMRCILFFVYDNGVVEVN